MSFFFSIIILFKYVKNINILEVKKKIKYVADDYQARHTG